MDMKQTYELNTKIFVVYYFCGVKRPWIKILVFLLLVAQLGTTVIPSVTISSIVIMANGAEEHRTNEKAETEKEDKNDKLSFRPVNFVFNSSDQFFSVFYLARHSTGYPSLPELPPDLG